MFPEEPLLFSEKGNHMAKCFRKFAFWVIIAICPWKDFTQYHPSCSGCRFRVSRGRVVHCCLPPIGGDANITYPEDCISFSTELDVSTE